MDIRANAIEIARTAGALLRQGVRESKQIVHKTSEVDLVTQYDRQSEALIISHIREQFPEDGIVAEEGGARDGRRTWYIDPLDGTNNFAHGFPHFAVSMALYADRQPLVAVTYDPLKDECFSAARGEGCYLSCGEATERLQVTTRSRLVECLLATGFSYDRHTSEEDNVAQLKAFLKKVQCVRRAGSASLDLAYVAAGRLDGFWEFKLGPWDVAAGVLLVREAGGTVTGMDGGPLELGSRVSIVANNGVIHEEMLQTLREVEARVASS
ncbi:MAG: inositol monophosphatase [Armatimonadetes bacterium]|nr:inositol monophosphatase [Armatimonadota bacterium]